MKSISLKQIVKFLPYLVLACGLYYLVIYIILAYFRMQYPFELEWLEGSTVDHVNRILSGQKIYVQPSIDFIPFIYTPLYFYLAAAVAKVIGPGFIPLRLVSFIASLGCFIVIFLMIKRETTSIVIGIISAGLFAAMYRISGAWLDIARVDTLFVFFLLVALYILRFKDSISGYILAGFFISCAFLTKQTALIIAVPLILYCLVINRRGALFFTGIIAVIVAGSTWFLNKIHQGWYLYYIFELPGHHAWMKTKLITFWTKDLFAAVSIACCFAVAYFLIPRNNAARKPRWFYGLTTAGMFSAAWLGRLNWGNYDNVLIPAYASIALLFGLGVYSVLTFIRQTITEVKDKTVFEIYLYLVCFIQFAALLYNPMQQLPTAQDLAAGKSFINRIASIPGDVYVPYHGYIPELAGKKSYASQMAISDILKNDTGTVKSDLLNELQKTFRSKRFSAIILDSTWFEDEIKQDYIKQGTVFDNQKVFWPVTGIRRRPEVIYIPN